MVYQNSAMTKFRWFGSQIDKLLSEINAVFRMADQGDLWNTISSYLLGLKAKELIGRWTLGLKRFIEHVRYLLHFKEGKER